MAAGLHKQDTPDARGAFAVLLRSFLENPHLELKGASSRDLMLVGALLMEQGTRKSNEEQVAQLKAALQLRDK